MERRSILVPHDFTVVADNAVSYALRLAGAIQANVDLLHIVKDRKDKSKATKKFEKVIDISITPNRADCLGIRGIARDLSSTGIGKLLPLKKKKLNQSAMVKKYKR